MSNFAGRAAYAVAQRLRMRQVILVYGVLTIVVAVLAVFRAGVWAGICALLAPPLMGISIGGLKAMFFWGNRNQKLFGIASGLAVGALAVWLAPGFSIKGFGYTLGGPSWTVVAGVLGLLASRRPNWVA